MYSLLDDKLVELHHEVDGQLFFEVVVVLLFDGHVDDENQLDYILMLLNPYPI
jgi:hypothetical protein